MAGRAEHLFYSGLFEEDHSSRGYHYGYSDKLQLKWFIYRRERLMLKPTKLRHCIDDFRKVRILELEQVTLWFKDLDEVDENAHLLNPNSSVRPKVENKIDWVEVFGSETVLQRKEIIDCAAKYGISEATIDRALKSVLDDDKLIMRNQGKYQLPDPTLSSSSAA